MPSADQSGRTLSLKAHGFDVALSPAAGGLIRAITWRGPHGPIRDLLYAGQGQAGVAGSPWPFGLWPMVPFANRAFGGVLRDGEDRHPMPVNDPQTGSTIHGFGWQAPWQVSHHGQDRLILRHQHNQGSDPYRYTAQLSISLVPGTVAIALSVLNEGAQALPFGIGLHPWFNCAADTTLRLRAAGSLAFAPGYRATGLEPCTSGGPYADGPVFQNGLEVAHSFVGWQGEARIETPSTGLGLSILASDTLRCPVVWAPAGAPFLCVEPQSHGIGAPSEVIAGDLTPLTRLNPGGVLSGWMRLTPDLLG